MKTVTLIFLLLACNGCALVGCDRVFPNFTWYWSSEAKRCRESHRMEQESIRRYQQSQQTNHVNL